MMYTVTKVDYSYHKEIRTVMYECDTAQAAFAWIDDNPIADGKWSKYIITVER